MGDDAVSLSWSPVARAAAGYNIYRSDDPAAPPAAHYLVARTTSTSFTDRGLHIKTPYFYRVAAVSPGNLQGSAISAGRCRARWSQRRTACCRKRTRRDPAIAQQADGVLAIERRAGRRALSCLSRRHRRTSRSTAVSRWSPSSPRITFCSFSWTRACIPEEPITTKCSLKIGRAIAKPIRRWDQPLRLHTRGPP